MLTNRARLFIAAGAIAAAAYFVFVPPIAQDETYRSFADVRLVWDRLPRTLVFMALLACVVSGERDYGFTRWLLALLVTCGIASVMVWCITNDLRLYALVQFVPFLILVPALWFVRDARYLAAVFGFYSLAKLAEFWDRPIFSGLSISGHSIKHVLAGIATYFVLRWRLAAAL